MASKIPTAGTRTYQKRLRVSKLWELVTAFCFPVYHQNPGNLSCLWPLTILGPYLVLATLWPYAPNHGSLENKKDLQIYSRD